MVAWEHIQKNQHLVMVVPRKKIFGSDNAEFFEGFKLFDNVYYSRMIHNTGFLTRGVPGKNTKEQFAESDNEYKQIIPYALIVNTQTKKVYVYRRASSTNHHFESRLHGNWSWGVGGHVDFQEDALTTKTQDFLKHNLERELYEEVTLTKHSIQDISPVGFINDEQDSVGQVHFGIIYCVETSATTLSPKDGESVEGRFMSLHEVEELCRSKEAKIDNWSRMALEYLRVLIG
jgi:predicted NUDIX family phosphoesterase